MPCYCWLAFLPTLMLASVQKSLRFFQLSEEVGRVPVTQGIDFDSKTGLICVLQVFCEIILAARNRRI
jgi:hypothetical protein